MSAVVTIPPARRPELVLRPFGSRGRYVIKDPVTGEYFQVGEAEYFLLSRLDGTQDVETICAAFREHFGEPFAPEDLEGFLELARARGFLRSTGRPAGCAAPEGQSEPARNRARQSLLYWRLSLFDPDRLLNRLAPELRFVWTRAFLLLSGGCILLAGAVTWGNRQELVSCFAQTWRWETVLLVWLTLVVITTCHEFAHGLTCKHYGGEVHEVGFLLLFFLPCFYCNVSDAWLFKEKSKRLWVMLAGGWCDLCLWALSVFAWRLTLPSSLLNYLAWVVLSVLGARVFFNFNPLLKLDGYYLLSDALELPNLRQRAWGRTAGWLRCLLWGAAAPVRERGGLFLLGYGLASWLFSLVFLVLMLAGFYRLLGARWGLAGGGLVLLLAASSLRGMFGGIAAGEVKKMILFRHKRTAVWILALGGAAAGLYFGQMEDRVSGSFEVRPTSRAEVRAQVAGFVREVYFDEGERVSPNALIVSLEVPDLESKLAQKRAAVRETQARLRLLEVGARPEEVREKRAQVERATKWHDLAKQDLARARKALQEDLQRLDKQAAQHQAELDFAQNKLERNRKLRSQQSLSEEEYREAEKQVRISRTLREQVEARKRSCQALGTTEAEAELARREKELADAQGALALLEAGSRPEEIDAERAHLARLEEEAHYLDGLRGKQQVCSPVAGLIATPHLKEKVGQYVREGELICQVEEPEVLEVEIALPEQDAERVQPGQEVELKVRALPFQTFQTRVDRIAPRAVRGEAPLTAPGTVRGELPGTVIVTCRLEQAPAALRPGMTGYARVSGERARIGQVLADRILRFLRTEFWW